MNHSPDPSIAPRLPRRPLTAALLPAVLAGAVLAAAAIGGAAPAGAVTSHPAGASWSIQPTPNPGGTRGSSLDSVSCPTSSFCLAVGYKGTSTGGAPAAEIWSGSTWSVQTVPSPTGSNGGSFSGVYCASDTACVAVGEYSTSSVLGAPLAESWNGAHWSVTPVPVPAGATLSYLNGVSCSAASACVSVGADEPASTVITTLAEVWNGKSWRVTRASHPSGYTGGNLFGVSCLAGTGCTAVGSYSTSVDVAGGPLAEHWNGASWSVEPARVPKGSGGGSQLISVACPSATSCTATGGSSASGGSNGSVVVETWNGTAWSITSAPDPAGSAFGALSAVACPSPGACEAGGYSTDATGVASPLVETGKGAGWTISSIPLPAGALDVYLTGMSCSSSTACTAVGTYTDGAGSVRTLALRYAG